MLTLLTLLSSPAEACSLIYFGEPISSPEAGQVGPNFVVRPEGDRLAWVRLTDAQGVAVELVADELGQFLAPEDLEAGEYTLESGAGDTVAIEVLAQDPDPNPPTDEAMLASIDWQQEWVSEWLTASCSEIKKRRHTIEQITLSMPAAPQNGWALRVSDSSTERSWWAGLDEAGGQVTFEQDLESRGRLEDGERCLSLEIYDPQGALHAEEQLPCESRAQAPGCSSTGSRGGLMLGLAAMLGLVVGRRRRD